jgi:hypothetical protein
MATLSSKVENVGKLIICQGDVGSDSNASGKSNLIVMKLSFAGCNLRPVSGL